MLTVNCFKEDLPNKVDSLKEYNKLVGFLKSWVEKAESPEKVEEFVESLTKIERNEIWMRLITVLTSFFKFATKRAEFIKQVYADNKEKLSQETKNALLQFGNFEFDRATAMSQALEAMVVMFDTEKKGL